MQGPQSRAQQREQEELAPGRLSPGVSELQAHACADEGATFLWLCCWLSIGVFELLEGRVGRGGGRREGDWIRESLAQENPPPPPLCKFKQLSCLAQLRRQGLLLNLGAKGTDGAGGREGSPDGSLPLTPGPAVRI